MISENEKFNFSIDNINKIRNLNAKLKKEEERIRPFAKQLNDTLKKQVAEKQIDDFNICQELSVFSNKELVCTKLRKVEEGNPFMEMKDFSLFYEYTEESFYVDNWNELHKEHPLGN